MRLVTQRPCVGTRTVSGARLALRRGASALIVTVPLTLAALGAACTSTTGPQEPDVEPVDFDRAGLVAHLADGVIVPALDAFIVDADALVTATAAWRDAAAADVATAGAAHVAAQEAWKQAQASWQRAELMQIGPAAPIASGLDGAQDLRDEIYSWPTENPCAVDQQLVTNAFSADGWFAERLITLKGLDAIEYVTFVATPDNACAGPAAINQDGSWAALGEAEVTRRRAAYAAAASVYLAQTARALRAAWDGAGGYRARLLLDDGAYYTSSAEALDDVFAGLYYLELDVKDRKLAVPVGLHIDCANATCPEATETRWARHALPNIQVNLSTFRLLFTGGEGEALGFDDYLDAAGASDLNVAMLEKTDAALSTAATLEAQGDLIALLASDRDAVLGLYEQVKALTDDMKSQFVTALNLRVPDEGAGDND